MALKTDRVGELLEGAKRNRRVLLSPEGVPLEIRVAGHGERIVALTLDLFFMFAAIALLYAMLIALFFSGTNISVGMTLILFLAFIVRNLYFIHFELAWQGRTPGKRICGLRVISRGGGELTPSAIIARNLTREVELFLPVSLFFSLGFSGSLWQSLTLLGWVLAITLLPLFNKDHLRGGDLIGGTLLITMPKRLLLDDLASGRREVALAPKRSVSALGAEVSHPAATARTDNEPAGDGLHTGAFAASPPAAQPTGTAPGTNENYSFTHQQLSVYGNFELQVLEEFLRRPQTPANNRLLDEVCLKIRRKINWDETVPPGEVRRFLTDFYAAVRAELERGQLFGKIKDDKNSAG